MSATRTPLLTKEPARPVAVVTAAKAAAPAPHSDKKQSRGVLGAGSHTLLTSVKCLKSSMLVAHASSCSYPNPVTRRERPTCIVPRAQHKGRPAQRQGAMSGDGGLRAGTVRLYPNPEIRKERPSCIPRRQEERPFPSPLCQEERPSPSPLWQEQSREGNSERGEGQRAGLVHRPWPRKVVDGREMGVL